MLGIENSYEAYCLDEAVITFGNHVKYQIEKIEGKSRAERERKTRDLLGSLLKLPDEQRFRPFRRPGG